MSTHYIAFNGGPAHGTVEVVFGAEPERLKVIETPMRVSILDYDPDESIPLPEQHVYELRWMRLADGNEAPVYLYRSNAQPPVEPATVLIAAGAPRRPR